MLKAFALLPMVLAVSTASAQTDSSEFAQIVDATIRFIYDTDRLIAPNTPKVALKIDATMATVTGRLPVLDPDGRQHPEEVFSRVRSFSGATIVSNARARQCEAFAPADCMSNGVSLVISISAPVIKGDSATIGLFVRSSIPVSVQDSVNFAGWELNLRRAGVGAYRSHLVKTSQGWVVTNVATLGRS